MILFDVGANWGQDSLDLTRNNPQCITYAFEPTPELVNHLTRASHSFADRYNIYQIALSDFDGQAEFNIAAHHDWGTSSLLEFNNNLSETWKDRTDFYVDRRETVEVRRLDNWLKQFPQISQIDYFHCDTQGSDLAVLKGMGEYISIIVKGVIEVPDSKQVMLYKNQHTKEECMDFLTENGFEIYQVSQQQNEQNLHFRRK